MTIEDLEKALENLGVIEKGQKNPVGISDNVGRKKMIDDDDDVDGDVGDKDDGDGDADDVQKTPIKKKKPVMKEEEQQVLSKGLDKVLLKLTRIENRLTALESSPELTKGFKNTGTLLKASFDSQQQTNEFLKGLSDRLNAIENQSQGRKSSPTVGFLKGSYGERSEEDNGKKTLSLSGNKNQIAAWLTDKSQLQKGQSHYIPMYGDAAMLMEAGGALPDNILRELSSEFNLID